MSLVALAVAAAATPVGVGLSEWNVALYRPAVRVGVAKLNVVNRGEDPHDVAVRDASGRVLGRLATEVGPGGRATLKVRFRRPGRYQVFCTLAGHEALGMRATLKVTRAASRR